MEPQHLIHFNNMKTDVDEALSPGLEIVIPSSQGDQLNAGDLIKNTLDHSHYRKDGSIDPNQNGPAVGDTLEKVSTPDFGISEWIEKFLCFELRAEGWRSSGSPRPI